MAPGRIWHIMVKCPDPRCFFLGGARDAGLRMLIEVHEVGIAAHIVLHMLQFNAQQSFLTGNV